MSLFPTQAAGSVLLVGAGPGDLGLLTVTGLRALERADVIVADRLGARAIIDQLAEDRGAPLDAEIIDVGKQPGHHPVPQARINEILIEQARDADAASSASRAGTPSSSDVGERRSSPAVRPASTSRWCPGVTSANSVPALAGIPLTHRGVATAYTVVTGHDQIEQIGGGRDHTVVVLMGIGTLVHYGRSARPR
jgi:uroporphyrin-III C-methyltransferase